MICNIERAVSRRIGLRLASWVLFLPCKTMPCTILAHGARFLFVSRAAEDNERSEIAVTRKEIDRISPHRERAAVYYGKDLTFRDPACSTR